MANKKNDSMPDDKSDIEKKVEQIMGPTPEEATSQTAPVVPPKPGEYVPPHDHESEPTSAPIIPNDALPKEITEAPETETDTPPEPAVPSVRAEPADPLAPTDDQGDEVLDAAVDDISKEESDAVLAAEDAEIERATMAKAPKRGIGAKFKHVLAAWWGNPKARWITVVVLVLALLVIGLVPKSRYFVLNTAGVRASAAVTVLDTSTQQPLKNVTICLAGETAKTDENGKATVRHLKLGATQLVINRRAFAPVTRQVVVGWGSNPLGDFKLTPTGSQYTFVATDFLSGKPLPDAEVTSDDANAQADDKGKIVLTLDQTADETVKITATSKGYRDEVVNLDLNDKAEIPVRMVPDKKHAFVSKRSGKYDLYSIDVDGQNEKLLLAGSGNERDDIVVAQSPENDAVAYISTRDGKRDKDGFLLSTLSIIDTTSGEKVDVAQAEQVQLVDWIGSRIAYVQIVAGASASNPKRQRLMAYDYKSKETKELASGNYFNDVLAASGALYYAPSSAFQASGVGYYRINPDGTNKQTLLNKEVWNSFRTSYDHLSLSVGQDWYDYKLGDLQAGKVSGPPASQKNRLYRDSPDKQHSLWVDSRDGKGVLLEYNTAGSKADKVLLTLSGLSNPVYWLNDSYVIYRINDGQQIADYVVNLAGGKPRKIRDVTNTGGIDQWYYYR